MSAERIGRDFAQVRTGRPTAYGGGPGKQARVPDVQPPADPDIDRGDPRVMVPDWTRISADEDSDNVQPMDSDRDY